jgi:hypothetical protein
VHPQPPVAPTHQQDLQYLKHPQHPSHVMYRIINVGDSCVIEPSVTCNHCGYCKSHGH